jgi:hypothetical protein
MTRVLRFTAATVAGVALLLSPPAQAITVLGTGVNAEEVAALVGILTQSTQTAITVDQLLTKTQRGIEVAQETASLLRAASEVVVDFQYLSTNPNQIYDDAQASFGASFPELEAIARDVETARSNLAGERAGDPRTVFDLIAHARQTTQGSYQTLIAFDNLADGQLSGYLRNVALLKETAKAAQDLRQEAEGQINAQKAAIIAARAAAVSATAEAQSASANLETSRVLQQQYVNERRDRAAKELAKEKNAKDLDAVIPADESVDGLKMLRTLREDPTADVVPPTEGKQ